MSHNEIIPATSAHMTDDQEPLKVKPRRTETSGNRESWKRTYMWRVSDVPLEDLPFSQDEPVSDNLTDQVMCDILWALVGEGSHRLLEGSHSSLPGQSYEDQATLTVTDTHIVLRRSGGLDI